MNVFVGTSGFSYKEWKGSFYPDDLPAKEMLSYYASQLPAVEINNTFYRLPKASVLEGWAEQTPDHFRFAIKASRRITHLKRLNEVQDETDYLLETVRVLGPRLGLVLFQLPPNFKKNMDRLNAFLPNIPADTRAVFEFRHETWFDDEVYDTLRERNCALCIADVDDADPPEIVSTATHGYLRLRRVAYTPAELATWAARIADQGWDDAYVFFKHEDEATGPALARQFIDIVESD